MDSEPSNSKSETSTDPTTTAVPVRNTVVDSISDLNVAHHNLENMPVIISFLSAMYLVMVTVYIMEYFPN